jgi:hypothetical protein
MREKKQEKPLQTSPTPNLQKQHIKKEKEQPKEME